MKKTVFLFIFLSSCLCLAADQQEEYKNWFSQEKVSVKAKGWTTSKFTNLFITCVDSWELLKPKEKPMVKHLDLSDNHLDASIWLNIVYLMKICPKLESIDLSGNEINSSGVRWIVEKAFKHPSLKKIDFRKNPIAQTQKEITQSIYKKLNKRPKVDFILPPTPASKEGAFFYKKPNPEKFVELSLSARNIKTMQILAKKKGVPLEVFLATKLAKWADKKRDEDTDCDCESDDYESSSDSSSSLPDEGIFLPMDYKKLLSGYDKQSIVDISNKNPPSSLLSRLIEKLLNSKVLSYLIMNNCHLDEGDMLSLQPLLWKKKVPLKKIDLSHNHIGDEGLDYILEGLEENNNLEEIDISHNDFSLEKLFKFISNICQKPRALKKIFLSKKKFESEKRKSLEEECRGNGLILVFK
jgi:hypothetical protein